MISRLFQHPRWTIERLRVWLQTVADRLQGIDDRLGEVDAAGRALVVRVAAVEDAQQMLLAVTVVATVADLPANAGPRDWYRVTTGTVAERTAVYIGNGPNLPLTKITPTAL